MDDGWIESLCAVMHAAYENAAAGTGWKTQEASRKPWADVPEANKATMRVAVRAIVPLIEAGACTHRDAIRQFRTLAGPQMKCTACGRSFGRAAKEQDA